MSQRSNKNGVLGGLALLIGLVLVGGMALMLTGDHYHGDPNKIARKPKQLSWTFDGMTGTFDRQAIQRGFQVYKEVCSACHGLTRVAFRNLQSVGFSEAEVKALAAEYTFTTISDDGEEIDRPGKPSDRFPSPYPNEQAGRSVNNGAWPPDLSLMVKARKDGANYLYSLLTGYSDPPAGFDMGDKAYNPYYEGRKISMAPPLMEGGVEYADGTAASVDQMARDVVYFLQWAAEPEMEERKQIGIRALIFLLILSVFFYIAKQRIWRDVK